MVKIYMKQAKNRLTSIMQIQRVQQASHFLSYVLHSYKYNTKTKLKHTTGRNYGISFALSSLPLKSAPHWLLVVIIPKL